METLLSKGEMYQKTTTRHKDGSTCFRLLGEVGQWRYSGSHQVQEV